MFAFFAILLVPVLQFKSPSKQFTVSFKNASNEIGSINLDSAALKQRINYIVQNDPDTGNVFIVCAMGGGSRAGYITAGVLRKIDSINSNLYSHTICYSTVSGGSVGVYNYIIGKEFDKISDIDYLQHIYQKNYNSSGVYGLLIGDALETLFGNILTKPRGWLLNDTADFYDRNYRIRNDYILSKELSGNTQDRYINTTFSSLGKEDSVQNFLFKDYYLKRNGSIPIHLINTFEINSGRRTVLSPFPTKSKTFFSNSITPLQDTAFDPLINKKDILYRDAVNLSELFPLISAASHIGTRRDAQFVDGGYYENYGLATALDVFYYLKDSVHISPKRLKILLIKNSRQSPADSGHKPQLFAPLVGVMEAPFTGHANNLVFETMRALDKNNFDTIVFDAKLKDVPLTRSLTERHIDSMQKFIDSISQDINFNQQIKNFIKN